MTKKQVLIVDDEPDIRELLEITLMRMGVNTQTAESVQTAIDALQHSGFDLCLTDMKLPDGDGLNLIDYIQRHYPDLPVAMITAFGSVETAIGALKAGAFDFVTKPIDLDRLRKLVEGALRLREQNTAINYSEKVQLLGDTPSIRNLRAQIEKLARSQAPVFISGESGSGKEVVARLIHNNGPRSSAAFVAVNCGAIPTELMESEFFGHVKGSFTGAFDHKQGLFEAAGGGTLFLDEVADLPLPMQVKLLRAIQEKAIRKVGSNEEIPIDVRILSATHKNLAQQVDLEKFRNDLFYRINVIEVRVPSLRERKDDIPLLADFALSKLATEWSIPKPELTPDAKQALLNYDFPGNVRQLENILERAFTLCENNRITIKDLQLSNPGGVNAESTVNDDTLYHVRDPGEAFGSLDAFLEQMEREALLLALEKCRWNKTAAAEMLGISFRQMRYRLSKLKIDA